jgi:2',3'-cyclic-nucleotide 2'-phosphodiesterase (5'-nucleotidase family)
LGIKKQYSQCRCFGNNIGGIRAVIGAGDILVKNVFEVMPFENEIVLVKMKGSDLDGLFNYYAETEKNNPFLIFT